MTSVVPGCVPPGIFKSTKPSTVVTFTVVPAVAACTGIQLWKNAQRGVGEEREGGGGGAVNVHALQAEHMLFATQSCLRCAVQPV